MGRTGALLTCMGMLVLSLPRTAGADELADLKAQVERVREENQALREQLDRQRKLTERLVEKVEALESTDEALSRELKTVAAKPLAPVVVEKLDEPVEVVGLPTLTIKGFGDVSYATLWKGSTLDQGFFLGAMDLFFLSQLNDRVSFMLESDLHWHGVNATAHFHVERANLKYALSDLLNVKLGKVHTPLGYWNQTFHHGSWLQTTIFRPEIYEFERPETFTNPRGGFLPVHNVGLELFGTKPFPGFDGSYSLGVYNGRHPDNRVITNVGDLNDSKATNVLLSVKPHAIEGLEFGTAFYVDKIPPSSTSGTEDIEEIILGWYSAYVQEGWELLGETFYLHHDDKGSGEAFNSWGGYVQAGYEFKPYTPYYRYDFLEFGDGNPFFTGRDNDLSKHTFGVRWDVFDWNAIKFEYSYAGLQGPGDEDEHQLTVNTSWAF